MRPEPALSGADRAPVDGEEGVPSECVERPPDSRPNRQVARHVRVDVVGGKELPEAAPPHCGAESDPL